MVSCGWNWGKKKKLLDDGGGRLGVKEIELGFLFFFSKLPPTFFVCVESYYL
jgi:hypothetical protein